MSIILDKSESLKTKESKRAFKKIVDLLTINEKREAVKFYNGMTDSQKNEYHRYLSEMGYDPWKSWLAVPFTKGKELFNLNR